MDLRRLVALTAVVALAVVSSAAAPPPKAATSPAAAAPAAARSYYLIPIKGGIGSDFTAMKMKFELERAKSLKIDTIVLELDTPGGSTADAEAIINLIIDNRQMRFIALVRRALSAGAAITMACKEIYATPQATIGAATSFREGADGLPKAISEKFQSAWRAVCRKAAENGGHPPILAEGMVDSDFDIYMQKDGRNVSFSPRGPGVLIRPRGRILTLTAREAERVGLVEAMVDDLDSMLKQLNMAGWKKVTAEALSTQPARARSMQAATPMDIYEQAIDFHMFDPEKTELQRQEATRQWVAALNKNVLGKRLVWPLVMIEAGKLDEAIEPLKAKKAAAEKRFQQYKQMWDASRGGAYMLKDQMDADAATIAECPKAIAEIEACPVMVLAYVSDDLPMAVIAWAQKDQAAGLAKVSRDQQMHLSGEIVDITLSPTRGGEEVMVVTMSKCRVAEAPKAAPIRNDASAPPSKDDESQVRLRLAEQYEVSKLPQKAKALLQSIIKDFPDSAAAKEAKSRLEVLEKTN
jgi:ATP-dependent protease ClpP protease subunit